VELFAKYYGLALATWIPKFDTWASLQSQLLTNTIPIERPAAISFLFLLLVFRGFINKYSICKAFTGQLL